MMNNAIPLPKTFLVLSRLQSGTEEVCRLDETMAYAATVSAAKDAEIAALREALENIAGTTDGTDCNAIATRALKGDW